MQNVIHKKRERGTCQIGLKMRDDMILVMVDITIPNKMLGKCRISVRFIAIAGKKLSALKDNLGHKSPLLSPSY